MGSFSLVIVVHIGNFSLVIEINKMQLFKFPHSNRVGVFILEN